MKKNSSIIAAVLLFALNLNAQNDIPEQFKPRLLLRATLIDANHWENAAYTAANFHRPLSDGQPGFEDWAFSMIVNPSMNQATELNLSAVNTLSWGAQHLANTLVKPKSFVRKSANAIAAQLLSAPAVYALGGFPLGGGWLHEEYHRAVLATNRVASNHPFTDFKLDLSDGSVRNLYDDALSNFKRNDPHSFIRMLTAGAEGELIAVQRMQENNFFEDANLPIELTSIIYTASATAYLGDSYESIDDTNIPLNEKDGADVLERDFTGHDFSGWIWHLFRPDVPYDSLGIHPSGVGINRYITSDRLTAQEKEYYDRIKQLAGLSFISPMFLGFRKIKIKDGVYGNFAMQYQANAFGTDLSVRLYFKNLKNKFCFGFHNYSNYENDFYAAEFNWVDFHINNLENVSFTSRIMLGAQPENQDFFTDQSQFFGLLSVNTQYQLRENIGVYLQLQAKTEGWVAGDEYLSGMVRARTGLSLFF